MYTVEPPTVLFGRMGIKRVKDDDAKHYNFAGTPSTVLQIKNNNIFGGRREIFDVYLSTTTRGMISTINIYVKYVVFDV